MKTQISNKRSLMYRRKTPLDREDFDYYNKILCRLGLSESKSTSPSVYSSRRLTALRNILREAYDRSNKPLIIASVAGRTEMEKIKASRKFTTFYNNSPEDYDDEYEPYEINEHANYLDEDDFGIDKDSRYEESDRGVDEGYLEDLGWDDR